MKVSKSFDQLTSIPYPLPSNVESLDLRDNQIRRIDVNSFSDLPELKVLLLSKNQIEYIAPGAFENMMTLEILFLHQNNLDSLINGAFQVNDFIDTFRTCSKTIVFRQ